MDYYLSLLFEYRISSIYYITSSFLSFGLTPAEQLNVPSVVANQSVDVSLPLATTGQVQRMDPLTNLQVANKPYILFNNVHYKKPKNVKIYYYNIPGQYFDFNPFNLYS